MVVPYGVLARRGSCRERCLIDRQMPCDKVEGSRGLLRQRNMAPREGRAKQSKHAELAGVVAVVARFLRGRVGCDRRKNGSKDRS